MIRTLLKSKLHRATVTDANLQYEGSISIDPELIEAADLLPFEQVEIYNITNGQRFATYVIVGHPGEITLNGAAARLVQPGDCIIIASYAQYDETEAMAHEPTLVYLNAENAIKEVKSAIAPRALLARASSSEIDAELDADSADDFAFADDAPKPARR